MLILKSEQCLQSVKEHYKMVGDLRIFHGDFGIVLRMGQEGIRCSNL